MENVLKGRLSFLILHLLSQKQLSGKGLVEEIAKRKGSKLSPGTIYPTLELLKKKGYVWVIKKIEKENVYGLTDNGREQLNEGGLLFKKMPFDALNILRDD